MIFTNNIDPVLLALGPVEVRWYGALFALGIMLNYLIIRWAWLREGKKLELLESVVVWLFVGLVVGARLGHVFFYDAKYFLANPLEILQIWNGGLASHGAAIGLFVALYLWTRVKKVRFSEVADLLVLGMPVTAGFVRIGNYFNSEIIGKPTDGSWGVVFERLGEDFPRHPSQFYEAGLSFAIFFVLFWAYLKFYKKARPMYLVILYVTLYFSTRFLVEIFKQRHTIPDSFPLSMGQILSLAALLIVAIFAIFFWKRFERK